MIALHISSSGWEGEVGMVEQRVGSGVIVLYRWGERSMEGWVGTTSTGGGAAGKEGGGNGGG